MSLYTISRVFIGRESDFPANHNCKNTHYGDKNHFTFQVPS